MSYCIKGDDSDVRVYLSAQGGILLCADCTLMPGVRMPFNAFSTDEMVRHLNRHVAKGHDIPDGLRLRLLDDDKSNFIGQKIKDGRGLI